MKTLHDKQTVKWSLPKVVFVMKSSMDKFIKVYPIPYNFEIDFKKIKELTQKCQN